MDYQELYKQYRADVRASDLDGMDPQDAVNIPMSFDEFVAAMKEQDQSYADDGPYGRIE
jgi:hypothetical protein